MSIINDGHLQEPSKYVIIGEASTRRSGLVDALSMKLTKDPDMVRPVIRFTNPTVWTDDPFLYKDAIVILEDPDLKALSKNSIFRGLIINSRCYGITLILLVLPGMYLQPEFKHNMDIVFIDRSCIPISDMLYKHWGLYVSNRSFRRIIKSLDVDEYLCITESLNITDITLTKKEINPEILMDTVDDTMYKLTTIIKQLTELRNNLEKC